MSFGERGTSVTALFTKGLGSGSSEGPSINTPVAVTWPARCSRRRSGAAWVSANCISRPAPSATVPKTATMVMSSSSVTSVLDVRNPPHDQRADDLQKDRDDDHPDADGIAKQGAEVIGIEQKRCGGQRRWQACEHPAGDAAVRRDDLDLPLDLEAIADDRRKVVEDLGEIATGLALRQHRRDEEPRVEHGDP